MIAYWPDAIKIDNRSHVFWKRFGGWPMKCIHDWNYVTSTLKGCHNFLKKGSCNSLRYILYLNFMLCVKVTCSCFPLTKS